MESVVKAFFERYEALFNRALAGTIGIAEVTSSYAAEFIAASPAGVLTGKNDAQLESVMERGYSYYRSIGTKEMRIRQVEITPIDELHCLTRVDWIATYTRPDRSEVSIPFEVHYLVQVRHGTPKVFGWITGDEQALLREYGIGSSEPGNVTA
jgi:hypothetical protein